MTISGRTRILAAVGAAVALTVTGPAYAGGTTSAKTSATAAAKPVVGECRSLTLAEAAARTNSSPPIDCALAHNSRVIAVRNLPQGATYADLTTKAELFKAVTKICNPAFHAAVGQSDLVVDRTAYSFVWFTPTKQQKADGARWLRCDLTILHGTTYGDLPTDAVPAVPASRIPASAKRCLTGKSHIITTCTASHSFRTTGAFTVGLKKFPGRNRMIQIGRNRCPALVTSRSYLFTWKPKGVYNTLHDHTVVCFSKTKD